MKRSAQVALVVMAATGVGTTAYSLMPSEDCTRYRADPAQYNACQDRRGGSSHSSYVSSSRGSSSNASSSGSHAGSAHSGAASTALMGGTQRGGFGGLASHFSSGGG